MDMSKVKNVFSKLSFIRNYSAYILPIVLVLVAVGLIAVSGFISSGLRSTVEKESIKLGKSVRTLDTEGVSARQWQVEKAYQDALEVDANSISRLLIQTSERELLSYNLFPEPVDTSVQIFERFGQRYRAGIEELISSYGARDCPTVSEIDSALQQTSSDSSTSGGTFDFYESRSRGRSSSGSKEDKVKQMIIDELCRSAASKASFYASPLDIAGYEYWGKSSGGDEFGGVSTVYSYQSISQSVTACWYWQSGYWIIEDVFKTIEAVNSQCSSVQDCPVKRLMRISFDTSASGGFQSTGMSVPPSYIKSSGGGATRGYTGRISDEQWDVVHFKLVVLIDPRILLSFIDELCSSKEHTFKGWSGNVPVQTFRHNQITVLETKMSPVDLEGGGSSKGEKGHELYRYGDAAVVQVELMCEYIFERAGYDDMKAEFIKEPPLETFY